ncbi:hypothetical protein PT974_04669 [Cladobotryum mycophilum]|uniref:Uncharacterized protein n=1 Tax=Cladobotryum mycophilum TaxID=491253 RepID=A0ABR0SVN8_9HYPO
MISTRGGIESLSDVHEIRMMIFWVDTISSLLCDQKPRFPIPLDLIPLLPRTTSSETLTTLLSHLSNLCPDPAVHHLSIISALQDIQDLSTVIESKLSIGGNDLWREEVFLGLRLNPIAHRLLDSSLRSHQDMSFSTLEALRLGAILWILQVKEKSEAYPGSPALGTTTISLIGATLAGLASTCNTSDNYVVTFYGWPDNDPPGPGTAHDCSGRNYKAGGSGSYDDPITIATAPGELNECETIYIPLLKKYGRYEDDCAQCASDWGNGQPHIDIWTGSNSSGGGQSQIDCENNLTSGGRYSIVRDPGKDYEVDSTPLFVPPSTCNRQAVHEDNQAKC